ncbi:NPCBM/NEW2 domain-containing protein [Micromonospora peucetia]|uniref:NPCBM/NEW2 domain-containing protein n=1 Tax=Micromonospora peucetia TaxID=47871 RepID=A0A1C6VYV7_9ACTN|nr:NPCBM/NEW2 domain-containing protein [Micromonospora peucetia]
MVSAPSGPGVPGHGPDGKPRPAPARRPLGEVAALVSAGTGLLGLLLGFFGLPAVVNSPTAARVTVTETVVVPGPTVTVTAPSADRSEPGPGPSASSSGSAGVDRQALTLLDPVDGRPMLSSGSGTLKGEEYPDAATVNFCIGGFTEYNIGTNWKRFTATAGLDDSSSNWPMTVQIYSDGRRLVSVRAGLADPKRVDVDVTGATRLRIGYELLGNTCDYDNKPRLVLGTPTLSRYRP